MSCEKGAFKWETRRRGGLNIHMKINCYFFSSNHIRLLKCATTASISWIPAARNQIMSSVEATVHLLVSTSQPEQIPYFLLCSSSPLTSYFPPHEKKPSLFFWSLWHILCLPSLRHHQDFRRTQRQNLRQWRSYCQPFFVKSFLIVLFVHSLALLSLLFVQKLVEGFFVSLQQL